MLEIIYIIEDDSSEDCNSTGTSITNSVLNSPNIVSETISQFGKSLKQDVKTTKSSEDSLLPITAIPLALLVAATAAAPQISSLLASDQQDSRRSGGKLFSNFLRKNSLTIATAKERSYRFPPGHPKVGQSYRLHPLAHLTDLGKEGVYIPQNDYDEILLEEREAELLRLLVELGATKISISECTNRRSQTNKSASINAEAKIGIEASTDYDKSSTRLGHDSDSRDFELAGRPWNKDTKIDRAKFAWVSFEPSWEALVIAREVGQCTKAAIEIKEETFFASEKRTSAELKSKIASASGTGNISKERETGRVYIIKAEFAAFLN